MILYFIGHKWTETFNEWTIIRFYWISAMTFNWPTEKQREREKETARERQRERESKKNSLWIGCVACNGANENPSLWMPRWQWHGRSESDSTVCHGWQRALAMGQYLSTRTIRSNHAKMNSNVDWIRKIFLQMLDMLGFVVTYDTDTL